MSKQLIVVVHGVGVKQAGVSSDMLSAAIEDPPEAVRDMSRKIAAAGKLRPHSSDDFHLREYEIHSSGGKRRIFPARIRRFRQYDKQHKISRERVIADFYWGDITTFTTGIIGLFMAIIRTILGISHAIRENARNAFPGHGKRNRSIRAAASLAALTIHGPIAAINIVLLGGVLLAWALQWMTGVSGGGLASIYLCGAISIGGGLWLLRTASPYLSRFLGEWIIIAGAVVLVFAIAASFDGRDPFSGLDYRFMWSSCHWDDAEAVKTASCIAAYEGIYLIGLRLLQLMNICWLIVLSAGAFIWLGQLTDTRKKSDKSPNLVVPSISAMMLAWILLIGCVWAAIARLGPGIIPHEYHLSSALNALLVVLAFLVAIGVAAVFVIIGRAHWAGQSGNVDLAKVVNRTEANRLIVAQSFIFLLYVFFFGALLLAIHQVFGALDAVLIAPLDEFRN